MASPLKIVACGFVFAVLCVRAVVADPAPAEPPAPVYLRLATGAVSGTYFPIGQAMGRLLSRSADAGPCEGDEVCGIEGLTLVPMASEGTLANLQLVAGGFAEMALVQADLAGDAYQGKGVFAKAGNFSNLRAIARLYPEAVHVIVLKNAKIHAMTDLKGKRIAIGSAASGVNAEARAILKAFGFSASNTKLLEIGGRDALDGLAQGEIDAMFFVGGVPVALVTGLNQSENIRLVPVTGKAIATLLKTNSALTRMTIPDTAYPGLGPVETLGVATLWVTTQTLDNGLVQRLCETFWKADTQRRLADVHPSAALLDLGQARTGLTLPLHEGAKACYDTLGVREDATPAAGPHDAPPMPRTQSAIPVSPAALQLD